MKKQVSCIICAYNEGERMAEVLAAVTAQSDITEVIVVDDASKDNTREVARRYPRVRLVSHEKNQGKSSAVATGIDAARYETLALFDADIIGITGPDITALLEPVFEDRADVTISLRRNAFAIYRLIGLDFSSGERVIPKKLLEGKQHDLRNLAGFGLEVYMNNLIISERLRVTVVYWPHVEALMKWRKMGFWKGWYEDLRMSYAILKTVSLPKLIRQNVALLKLIRRTKNAPAARAVQSFLAERK